MNGITYYKLVSRYPEDITKNCALKGSEIDDNFYTLEGRDIKSVNVMDGDLVITLYNGTEFSARVLSETDAITGISFNEKEGVLSYVQNGETCHISGFTTTYNDSVEIATDNTLSGTGTAQKPLGIAGTAKTGTYRPVKKILKLCACEKLPHGDGLVPGDRFLTEESVSNYGYLYDYKGVMEIACDLHDTHSTWRVPSKEDWDDMLDAVEPCEEDRNHGLATDNRNLGRWAGKLLKSKDLWITKDCGCECDDDTCIDYGNDNGSPCNCGQDINCSPVYCAEYATCKFRPRVDNSGEDKYGFCVTPAGYADDNRNFLNFKERAYFWTGKTDFCTSTYTKRFDYDRSTVHQEIIGNNNFMSLRLIKDYNGSNFNESEDILGSRCSCVLMPSMKKGSAIWTSVNVAFGNKKYHPLAPNDNEGLTSSSRFFINEWNGRKWERAEMKEGESVVLMDSPKGERDAEYRLVDGHLVSVNEMVYMKVSGEVKKTFDRLQREISDETWRAKKAEDDIREATKDADNSLSERIEAEAYAREAADTVINEKIENLENSFNEALQTETEERKAADEALQAAIDELKENSDASIQEVKEALEAEVNERKEADDAEATARTEADDNLQGEIDTINSEISNINGDITSLQGDIKDLFDGATKNDTVAFDPETGLLTSTTFSGTTNTVQFSFNFGTF